MKLRKLQIGVMGACEDLKYGKDMEVLAEQVGEEIAKRGAVLVFGAERDFDSLSTAASRGAKKAGGLTVGVTYGKGLDDVFNEADIIIATGLERGGGREFSLVLSCDGIITINGGSGTLNEMVVAYQAGIPIIALKNSGGWSEKLAGEFIDDRKRLKVVGVENAKEAIEVLITLIENRKVKQ